MGSSTFEIKGGDKLAGALKKIADQIDSGAGGVKVGFLEDATYPTDADVDSVGLSVAQVAFWNEFGTVDAEGGTRIPPRPFFRGAINEHADEWGGNLAAALKASDMDTERSFNILGTIIKDQIVQSIVDLDTPGLAESTITRKGFDTPLIDTGVMQRSVDYVVLTGDDGS